MNKYTKQLIEHDDAYYRQAVGLTIVDVEVFYNEYDNDVWTRLICERTVGGQTERFELELSQDPEGNGPGFLFGLPTVAPITPVKESV